VNKKNFMVGLTVLVAAGIFAWMILRFGAKTASIFAPPQEQVQIDAPRVDGLAEGSPLTYQGVVVGRVLHLQRNASGNGITVLALLSTQPPVPVNVNAEIEITNLLSSTATVSLELRKDLKTGVYQRPVFLKPGTPYPVIHAAYVGLQLQLFPPTYGNTAEQIAHAATAIADFGQEVRQRQILLHLDQAVQNVNAQATRAGQVLQSIQEVLGDPNIQHDLRQVVANALKVSEQWVQFSNGLPKLLQQASQVEANANGAITHVQGRVDELSKQIGDQLTEVSRLLDSVHSIAEKINQGQGTAGLLLNDPKLYQGLVDASRQLNVDLQDLDRLMEQWEQEGVPLKLK
jgi:phospholipid/cholesterol/gamma-HCH transport system substrate-binding protein